MNLANKLENVVDIKNSIKNTLISKGAEIDDTTTFREYANIIGYFAKSGGGGNTQGYRLAPISNYTISSKVNPNDDEKYIHTITWEDPIDRINNEGEKIAEWEGTLLIRNTISPRNILDGEVIGDFKEHNSHYLIPLELEYEYSNIWYGLFPYTKDNVYNYKCVFMSESPKGYYYEQPQLGGWW